MLFYGKFDCIESVLEFFLKQNKKINNKEEEDTLT
jgi:hypothetical protein